MPERRKEKERSDAISVEGRRVPHIFCMDMKRDRDKHAKSRKHGNHRHVTNINPNPTITLTPKHNPRYRPGSHIQYGILLLRWMVSSVQQKENYT